MGLWCGQHVDGHERDIAEALREGQCLVLAGVAVAVAGIDADHDDRRGDRHEREVSTKIGFE